MGTALVKFSSVRTLEPLCPALPTRSPTTGLLDEQLLLKLQGLLTEPVWQRAWAMQDPTKTLQQVNNQLLSSGQSFPQVTMADGSKVQTGTFGACLANIRRYNQGERGEVEDAIRLALPTLVSLSAPVFLLSTHEKVDPSPLSRLQVRVGLFDLFPPQEWIAGDNPGRRFVGECVLEQQAAAEAAAVPAREPTT